ncbi:hypothetical protein LUZ62_057043 [Rhynchospora pubera]|uniref:Uncharacterized protein n=1 Tax=Rhynchospora pubera TaxID=906938 RepID=A0AAV8E0Y5_9POAL|nr:hypothetical protein LUZ62_057043 [Rhynchospora pubera]
MALLTKNSLDYAQLRNNSNLLNVSNNNPKEGTWCNLNTHESSEIISDPILDCISRYLLEEDIDDNIIGYQEEADLREMERPFYDVLGEKYPPSPKNQLHSGQPNVYPKSTTCLLEDQATKNISAQKIIDEHLLASEFQKGVEEGLKFLPSIQELTVDFQASRLLSQSEQRIHRKVVEFGLEKEKDFGFKFRSRGNENLNNGDFDISESENRKKPMICYEETIRDDMYDKVLLNHGESYEKEEVNGLREIMQCKARSYGSKEIHEKHIDLNTLLIHCSEAVSINDQHLAEELLMKIRKISSRTGNSTQRLACILADGLEARLAGSGSELYRQLVAKRVNNSDILKSYHLCIRADPFHRVSNCFANNIILREIKNSSKVHIVDLGISFGFQWPSLIQSLATRQGGPPKLRITGIDFPQRGFCPTNQVEEIGKRLEDYARSFNVPFKYQGIASEWESISVEDLNLREDEVCIVNSMLRFSRIRDEACNMDSPRNKVLKLVRQMKPLFFIQGIYSATFSPFFTLRFRQILSQFSMEFDIRDSLIPRDDELRLFTEREVIGPILINLIACGGSDWLERPETYKNWQLRNVRAGFEQLQLDPEVVKECRKKLRNGYDNRFFIEEDGNWMLQGWKGKIRYAISTWKPKADLGNSCVHKSC